MGIVYLAARPSYQARHRRPRRMGDAAAVACYTAATAFGALLLVLPGIVTRWH